LALGASARSIGGLVLSQLARPVGIGVTVGAGLAAALGIVLLSIPDAGQIAEIVHLLDPVAYAASLVAIIAACAMAALIPAWRAARVDPVATLRAE
jgi:ABC-type lipoprotein release transport system permease subunit